jgi:nucleoside phosphorylase
VVDMEVYGLYYAMKNSLHPQPKVFALKSVCDFADHEESDDFQHYAAYTSIQILNEISLNYLES